MKHDKKYVEYSICQRDIYYNNERIAGFYCCECISSLGYNTIKGIQKCKNLQGCKFKTLLFPRILKTGAKICMKSYDDFGDIKITDDSGKKRKKIENICKRTSNQCAKYPKFKTLFGYMWHAAMGRFR